MTSSVNGNSSFDYAALNSKLSGKTTSSTSTKTDTNTAAGMQDQFMKMLVAQLQNQDPTNPMDNSQMTAQLAQINTVSGIQQLNQTMATMTSALTAGQSMQAATALIGHAVMTPTDTFAFDGKTPLQAQIAVPAGTTQLQVQVVSLATGQVVDTMVDNKPTSGAYPINWNGTLADGTTAPTGSYQIVATGADAAGLPAKFTTNGWQLVDSITLGTTGVQVNLGNGKTVDMSTISQIG